MSGSGDYISREEAEKAFSQPVTMSMCLTLEECKQKNAQRQIDLFVIRGLPAADVRPRWIPVTERLPDSGTCVLVTDGLEVGEGWITEFINTKCHFLRWCCPTADIDIDRRPITHWMPLPEPPKEDN